VARLAGGLIIARMWHGGYLTGMNRAGAIIAAARPAEVSWSPCLPGGGILTRRGRRVTRSEGASHPARVRVATLSGVVAIM
jgi:hypothetical protein